MPINKISVVGLGYVGLPLVVTIATKIQTIAFDINNEVDTEVFQAVKKIEYAKDVYYQI